MRPARILQLVFVLGTGAWAASLAGGDNNWLTDIWTWIVVAILIVIAVGLGLGIIAWVLKLLGVIAHLPWTLDRKLNERP